MELTPIIDSEDFFASEKRHYFFDLKKARNRKWYLRITRSDRRAGGGYDMQRVVFFEEDIFFLVEGLTMLLGRYTHRRNQKEVS